MLYDTAGVVAASDVFRSRVDFFLTKAAIAVMSESGATPNHAERVTYSLTILAGTANVSRAALACMTNPTLSANANPNGAEQGISDGDLEFTVNSVLNALAGVST